MEAEKDNVFRTNGHALGAKTTTGAFSASKEEPEKGDGGSESAENAGEGPYNVRDIIFLDDKTIAPGQPAEIIIKSSKFQGRCLIQRIVMHKSCATKLGLSHMSIGGRDIARGSGGCDIFLVEVPNYTPQNLYIDDTTHLKLVVHNRSQLPLNVVGIVSVWRRKNESEER